MKRFIVWGCRLHEHTNSYVYAGYHKAAQAIGIESHWLTASSDVSGMDLSGTLFLTEGQHDANIPIRDDCTYILHNCTSPKWDSAKNRFLLQTYTYDADQKWKATPLDGFPGSYVGSKAIYQPWATDLLPGEIDMSWPDIPRTTEIHWVGTLSGGRFGNEGEVFAFRNAAIAFGCSWFHHPPGSTSFEQNRKLIQRSLVSPTITGTWQTENGYIPCRLFKNSSYGHLMATNNKACFDLMDGLGVYSHDPKELFNIARGAIGDKDTIRRSMELIRDKHTFVSRINALLKVIKES